MNFKLTQMQFIPRIAILSPYRFKNIHRNSHEAIRTMMKFKLLRQKTLSKQRNRAKLKTRYACGRPKINFKFKQLSFLFSRLLKINHRKQILFFFFRFVSFTDFSCSLIDDRRLIVTVTFVLVWYLYLNECRIENDPV